MIIQLQLDTVRDMFQGVSGMVSMQAPRPHEKPTASMGSPSDVPVPWHSQALAEKIDGAVCPQICQILSVYPLVI